MSSHHPTAPGLMTPKGREDVLVSAFLDSCVVVDPRSDEAHMLNAAAAFVFSSCDGATHISAIARTLSETTGLAVHQAEADVQACLSMLREKNLLDG